MVFVRSSNAELKRLYSDINELRMEVVFPFLIKVHMDYQDKIINESTLIEIIAMCISYVFRRSVCEIPTNSLNKTFATLKNEIKTNDYLRSIKAFFILEWLAVSVVYLISNHSPNKKFTIGVTRVTHI